MLAPMEAKARFAANLRRMRLAAGLTQEDLSRATGLHVVTISRFETGQREPLISTALLLADALDTSLDDLVQDAGYARQAIDPPERSPLSGNGPQEQSQG